jgi:hypothetical protein
MAGELGHDAEAVEAQLSFIFRLTSLWKVENIVAAAYALAIQATERVSMPYLFEAVASNEEFEDDFHGVS